MTPIIFRNGGSADKLVGDAIMAFFNVPAEDPDQADNPVKTAIEMLLEGLHRPKPPACNASWHLREALSSSGPSFSIQSCIRGELSRRCPTAGWGFPAAGPGVRQT